MIRRNGTYKSEVREAMRGGKGAVRIEHYWTKDELTSNSRLCAKLILAPGTSIGPHEHGQEEEVYIVLRGNGRIIEGETATDIGPGDTVLTGGGASHAVENIGNDTLELVAVIMQY